MLMTKSFISDKINSKPQFKASNFGAFIYSVKTQFICCIYSLDSLRSFTFLQLLLAWLWSLVLRVKVKQHRSYGKKQQHHMQSYHDTKDHCQLSWVYTNLY